MPESWWLIESVAGREDGSPRWR